MLGNGFSFYSLVEPGMWLVGTDTIGVLAQAARFTLAIQLMTTALQSPDFYYIKTWRVLFILLVPVMTLTFAISGLIAWGILGMGVNAGFLVGGFVAPTGALIFSVSCILLNHSSSFLFYFIRNNKTDPVIAASIVSGPFSERRLRQGFRDMLTAESGANDGLGFPFVYLTVSVLTHSSNGISQRLFSNWYFLVVVLIPSWYNFAGGAMAHWFLVVWLYDVVGGLMVGFLLGYGSGLLLLLSEWYHLIDKNNYFTFSTGLTFLVLGIARLLDMDEVFSVFAAGIGIYVYVYRKKNVLYLFLIHFLSCTFSAFGDVIREDQRIHELQVQEMLNFVVTLAFFLVFGLDLPFDQWAILGWRGPALCVALLIFKRLPFVMAFHRLLKPHVGNWKEALFLGWFGPVGVAAIYYAATARVKIGEALDMDLLWGVVTQLVVFSVVVHGLTAVPFTWLLWRINKSQERT